MYSPGQELVHGQHDESCRQVVPCQFQSVRLILVSWWRARFLRLHPHPSTHGLCKRQKPWLVEAQALFQAWDGVMVHRALMRSGATPPQKILRSEEHGNYGKHVEVRDMICLGHIVAFIHKTCCFLKSFFFKWIEKHTFYLHLKTVKRPQAVPQL